MKQRLFQNMLKAAGAFLFAVTMSAGFTACTDTIDNPATPENPSEQSQGVYPTPEPTEDAVAVTTDCSFVMFGEIEDEIGKAISRRLKGTPDVPSMAQLYFLDPQRGKDLGMGEAYWQELVRRTRNGEASLVLSQCTFSDFHTFTKYYIQGMMELAAKQYLGDDPDAKPDTEAMQAEAEKRMADALREGWQFWRDRQANPEAFDEPDWQNIDSWPAEMQDAVMFDAWGFHGANHMLYVVHGAMQDEGNEANETMTAYQWGMKADAVADWLNRQAHGDAQTRAGMADFRRALTRAASGSAAIADLMSAQTREYVFSYFYPWPWGPGIGEVSSGLKVQYTIYSAHNLDKHTEYYQVKQHIVANNGKMTGIDLEDNHYWYRENDPDNTYGYIYGGKWVGSECLCMREIQTDMKLAGNGTISLWHADPQTDNNSQSTDVSESSTTGWSAGGSLGGSVGSISGATGSGSLNFSYSESVTMQTGSSWSTKDLSTTYNENGNQPSWKYTITGRLNEISTTLWENCRYFGQHSKIIPQLAKSTCTTDENAIWKVSNPSGTYRLKANVNAITMLIKRSKMSKKTSLTQTWYNCHFGLETRDNKHEIEFDLDTPDRYLATWNCVVTSFGDNATNDMKSSLRNYLDRGFGINSAYYCWATTFTTVEANANSSTNAAKVFSSFENSITGLKQELYTMGYRGKVSFGLKRNGSSTMVKEITLNLDGFSKDEVLSIADDNGKILKYKITKAGEEVELSEVPWDFSGKLEVPAKITHWGNELKVTGLGSNCAKGCKSITAVTLPNTIRIIGDGALSEQNITEITVPEGVEIIDGWAFYIDSKLKKVVLPSTMEKIDYGAFNTTALTEIHIKATTPPDLTDKINFDQSAYNNAKLYVPKGCKSKYQNAENWKLFKNIVEE